MSELTISHAGPARWWRIGVAVLLGGALYLNALWNPFTYDDLRTVVENGSIASPANLRAIVLHELTRPLTNLTLAADRAVWGTAPFGFHLSNVLLHMLNIALVFTLAAQLWSDAVGRAPARHGESVAPTIGLAAALLFGAHPIMSEAVGYISSRADLLCTLLYLLAFIAGRRWLLTGRGVHLAATLGCWSLALLTKETAILLPATLAAWAFLLAPASARRRQTIGAVLMLAGLMVVAALARVFIFVRLEGGSMSHAWTLVSGTLVAGWMYGRLMLLSGPQSIFHAPPAATSVQVWGAGAGAALVCGTLWTLRHRAPVIVFGAVWCLVLLAPAALPILSETGSAVAEHRAYLPMAGVAVSVAGVCAACAPLTRRYRSTQRLAPLAFAALVLMCSGRTLLRNALWSDPVALWQEAAALSPGHWLPASVLGETLHREGRHEEAVAAFSRSVALRPDGEAATIDLAVCLTELGRRDDAERAVDAYERLRPGSAPVALGRGAIAALMGEPEKAHAAFIEAIDRDPGNVAARQWLMILAEQRNDRQDALGRCYELQRLSPGLLSVDACIARALSGR